jgi:DNA-binding CsgD family transcriptional regulator
MFMYKFNNQPYRLSRLDLTALRPQTGPMTLSAIVCSVIQVASQCSLHEMLMGAARALGFDSYTYGCLIRRMNDVPLLHVCTPVSLEDWLAYHESGFLNNDERIVHCGNKVTPGIWSISGSSMVQRDASLARRLSAGGLASGVFFPVHGKDGDVAMLALNSRFAHAPSVDDDLYALMAKGTLLANFLHEEVLLSGILTQPECTDDQSPQELTERERELLVLASKGFGTREMAELLSITERTATFHFSNILRKLSATNRTQAVAQAVELGIVKPLSLNQSGSCSCPPQEAKPIR